ncbi:MAG: twin-arginine translocase subunit TatC [Pirellulales bacterium]
MAQHDNEDDLFKHTAMSFGEHLEELRSALFKAVICLVIGFAIGLAFGSYIVDWVQAPLRAALEAFYQKEAIEYVNARVPADLQDNEVIKDLVYKDGLLPEDRYISTVEILNALQQRYPGAFSEVELKPRANKAQPAEAAGPVSSGAGNSNAAGGNKLREFSKDDMIRLRIWRPMAEDERMTLDAIGVPEPFIIYMKASFLFGALISAPFVFYFLWQFVAAGLYPHEKRYIHLFLPVSVILFLSGAALAFFFVFPPVLGYFFWIAESLGVQMRPRLSEWLSFVLLLPLGFGVAFQLPLLMLFLERIHVFNTQIYLSKWRIAVLLMAVAAMVLSPGGDPYSMLMMLVPLVGLYFAGIALCKWLPAGSSRPNTKTDVKRYAEVD